MINDFELNIYIIIMKLVITKELYNKWKKNKDVNPLTGRTLNKDSKNSLYHKFANFKLKNGGIPTSSTNPTKPNVSYTP